MSRIAWIPWQQPKLTSNTSYGILSASNNESSAWKAADGSTSGQNTSWEAAHNVYPAWWKWQLPNRIRVSKIDLYNKNNSTKVTKQVDVFADTAMSQKLGSGTFANSAFSTVTIELSEPIITDTIVVNCVNDYGSFFTGHYVGLGEVKLTAEIEELQYEVCFKDYNDAILKTDFITKGGSAVAPNPPIRDGYDFLCWDTPFDNITADTTIRPIYKLAGSHVVTFKNYDGTILKTEYVMDGESAKTPKAPIRDGYIFVGWDKPLDNITSDTVITATFKECTYHTVTFKDWNNTVLLAVTAEHGKSAQPPEPPTRSGYRFIGWNRGFNKIVADIVITAQYEELIYYSVTFRDKSQKVIKSERVIKGFSATAPKPPIVEDYMFTGWDKDFSNIQADTIVNALYSESCKVVFKDYDNTPIKTEVVIKESNAVPPLPPLRKGYIFEKWSEDTSCVVENMEVNAQYRSVLKRTVINIYSKNGVLLQTVDKVLSATLRDSLDGEMTLEFSTLAERGKNIFTGCIAELDGCYFNIVRISKSISNGVMVTLASCEHISYVLNDDQYKITEFYFSGKPSDGLASLLNGTPFSVGVVEFEDMVSIQINTEVTRRAALMQFIAILGGEIEYDRHCINIRRHRGATQIKELLESKNITDVSVTYESRASVINYDIAFHKKVDCAVGDEVRILFSPLDVDTRTRIIALEYNPFNKYTIRVEVGDYTPTINNSLYQMRMDSDNTNEELNDIRKDLNDFEDEYAYFEADYDSFLNTYKEVTNISVGDSSFSVSFSDGSNTVYNYSVDQNGRMNGITKEV